MGIGPGAKGMLAAGEIRQTEVIPKLKAAIDYLAHALTARSNTLHVKMTGSVPIYVGCQSPRLLELIGKWGVGGLPLLTPPAYATTAYNQIMKGADAARVQIHRDDQIASILVSLAKDEQEAQKEFAKFIIPTSEHLSLHQLSQLGIDKDDINEAVRVYSEDGWEAVPPKFYKLGAIGVEGCIRALNEVSKAGFTRVKIGSPLGPRKEEAINICAKEVMPHFR